MFVTLLSLGASALLSLIWNNRIDTFDHCRWCTYQRQCFDRFSDIRINRRTLSSHCILQCRASFSFAAPWKKFLLFVESKTKKGNFSWGNIFSKLFAEPLSFFEAQLYPDTSIKDFFQPKFQLWHYTSKLSSSSERQ